MEAQVVIVYFFAYTLSVLSGECRKILIQFRENYEVNNPSEKTETELLIVWETQNNETFR